MPVTARSPHGDKVGMASRVIVTALVLSLVALLAPAAALAGNYYVSPDGVDSRPCNLADAPCRTIGKALERARSQAGTHTIHVAARLAGKQAVYPEWVQVRRGATHQPTIILNGGWRGKDGQRALIAPKGNGATQVVSLELPGAELRNMEINAKQATKTVAGLVLDVPGSKQRVNNVHVQVSANQVGVVVNSESAHIRRLTVNAAGQPALDYSALGEPVLVEDSVIRQEGGGSAIRGSGLSALIFRRSMAFASLKAPSVIATEGGRLFLDSSLVSGSGTGAIHLGGATGRSLRAVSSTVDSGHAGVSDPGLAAVTLATGGNAEVEIIGSILLEPPLITVAGSAVIRCSYSDVPSTVVERESPPQTISCGAGVDGNSHHSPSTLFAGTPPFADVDDYRLRAGSPAINTGPNPAPPDATPFDLMGEARIQPPGTCAADEDIIDKGAIEFGCTPGKNAPKPPGLYDAIKRLPRPAIRGLRAVTKRVAPRHRLRIAFRLNTPARVVANVRGAKLRHALPKARAGRNFMVLPTKGLKPRRKPYRVKVIARAPGGVSKPGWVRFRIVAKPSR